MIGYWYYAILLQTQKRFSIFTNYQKLLLVILFLLLFTKSILFIKKLVRDRCNQEILSKIYDVVWKYNLMVIFIFIIEIYDVVWKYNLTRTELTLIILFFS
jgi:hypothetical protein